ncbi:MAG: PorT family protein [Prevotella sp.]|nr:PorT family protein [Prevotella sp.]
MKKVFLIAACAVFSLAASAQRASSSSSSFFSTDKAEQPVRFTIRGGVNFANIGVSGGGESESLGSRTAFNAGVGVDIPIIESFYVQTGLFFTSKGYKRTEDRGDTRFTAKGNPAYLEIPILASYRYNFNDATQLEVNVGPYLAFGIGGKDKLEEKTEAAVIETEENDFFNDDVKKFDMGLQVGLGVTFLKHVYLGVAYEFGFVNMFKDSDGESAKNRNFMINLGYKF